ncbi:EAL domain-containing protein [Exiguobacterium algae]|uniref:EAL domain-containing protein n=1 Tax=Exiguobacterium algae TaxID=2751250 RepID=UPI001BECB8F6|nr:EAL domain-containing protein [Exiguobacterium algae]
MKHMKGDPQYLFDLFVRLYRMVFLMEVTSDGYRYVQVSEQARIASSLPENVAGRYLHEMYRTEVADELIHHYDQVVLTGEPVYFMSKMNIEANTARFASSMLVPVEDIEGEVRYVIGLTTDLSEEAELKLLRSIEHIDYLTGMPNLMKVKLELEKLFEAEGNEETSVMRLHINRFKMMMSLQGVERSNQLIKEITRQVANTLPKGSLIGRVDGEDFIAVLPYVSLKEAHIYAEQLLEMIATNAYRVAEAEFPLSGCIGISAGTVDADRIILNASTALVEARHAGKQTIRLYEHDDYVQRYIDEITIEAELVKGLRQDELYMVYQPKVSMDGTIHFEALVRWTNPILGNVSPETFIRIAEQSLLIEDVTEFVMHRVCQNIREHASVFGERRVAVNISPMLFRQDYMDGMMDVIAQYQLQATQFEFEVTEHTLMQEPVAAIKTVESLKNRGVRLLIDDFGVSYSSLNYLKMFEIDGIKIDRSFISQLDQENGLKEYEIVKLIVSLAKKLNLEVTAEGVETEAQYQVVQQLGCDDVQGYFFSRPMLPTDIAPALDILHAQHAVLSKTSVGKRLLKPSLNESETERLKTILRLEILNTPQEERYDRITRLVTKTLQVPIAFISIMTTDQQWFKSCEGIELEASYLKREWTLCNRVVSSGAPFVMEDVAAANLESDSPWLKKVGFYAGVPLITKGGHVIGTLCVVDNQARTFDADALRTLEEFSHWVMAEVELSEETRRHGSRQQALESLYEVTSLQIPFKEQLERIQDVIMEWVGYSHAIVFSVEKGYRLLSERGVSQLEWDEQALRQLHRLTTTGHQKLQQDELVIQDISFASMISLPLVQDRQTFGWVVFLAEQGNLNDIVDRDVIQELTDTTLLVTRWMENEIRKERKHQEVARLAKQDPLTKLANRHAFMTDLYKKMNRSQAATLLFIDLDDFKRVNDLYGHLIGDEVLIETANRIVSFTERFGGKAYRFAGDEFLIVHEKAGVAFSSKEIETLNKEISGEIRGSNNELIKLSASIGISSTSNLESVDELIHQADAAMYVAKNNGGNHYYVYDTYQRQ